MADNSEGTPIADSPPKKARIEIIPLIDVIFFLLATFVLFTLSLNKIQTMETKLPITPKDPPPGKPKEPLIIQVSDGTTVYVAREVADMGDVYLRILHYKETSIRENETPRVVITGDDRAKYGSLIKALDAAKNAGVEDISFETNYRASGK